ncbi:MAG: hypothetical protein AAB839_02715 [Patescibacteria group bacterium]
MATEFRPPPLPLQLVLTGAVLFAATIVTLQHNSATKPRPSHTSVETTATVSVQENAPVEIGETPGNPDPSPREESKEAMVVKMNDPRATAMVKYLRESGALHKLSYFAVDCAIERYTEHHSSGYEEAIEYCLE